jgi:hypothetical protein
MHSHLFGYLVALAAGLKIGGAATLMSGNLSISLGVWLLLLCYDAGMAKLRLHLLHKTTVRLMSHHSNTEDLNLAGALPSHSTPQSSATPLLVWHRFHVHLTDITSPVAHHSSHGAHIIETLMAIPWAVLGCVVINAATPRELLMCAVLMWLQQLIEGAYHGVSILENELSAVGVVFLYIINSMLGTVGVCIGTLICGSTPLLHYYCISVMCGVFYYCGIAECIAAAHIINHNTIWMCYVLSGVILAAFFL